MAALKFLSLASAAFFLLDTNVANAADGATTNNTATRVDCLAPMNEARKLVGFSELVQGEAQGEKLPIDPASDTGGEAVSNYLGFVCKNLKTGVQSQTPTAKTNLPDGAYAYAVQQGTKANCEDAVNYWKAAFPNIKGLPPQYTKDAQLYNNPQILSFISLFNPEESPKVDCAYFICPAEQAALQKKSSRNVEDGQEQDVGEKGDEGDHLGEGDRDEGGSEEGEPETDNGNESATDKEVKALVCVTFPNVLKPDSAPYTQSEWDQITIGFTGGAAALPTFLGFATAALSILLL